MNRSVCRIVAFAVIGLVPLASACSGGDAAVDRRDTGALETAASRAAVPAGLARAEFAVEGMTCGACAAATRIALKKMDGVEDAAASYDESSAWALYDPAKVTVEEMMGVVRTLGYTPSLAESGAAARSAP